MLAQTFHTHIPVQIYCASWISITTTPTPPKKSGVIALIYMKQGNNSFGFHSCYKYSKDKQQQSYN